MKNKQAIIDSFIDHSFKANPSEYRRAKMLINISLLTSLFAFSYFLICWIFDFEKGVFLMLFDLFGFLFVAYLVRFKLNINFLSNLYIAIGAFAIYYLIIYSGGLSSPIIMWVVAAPILALLIANRGSAITWTIIMLFGIMAFSFLEIYEIKPENEIPEKWSMIASIAVLIGLMLLIVTVTLIIDKEKSKAIREAILKNKELSKTLKELTNTKNSLLDSHTKIKNKNEQLTDQKKEILSTTEKLKELNNEKDYIIEVLAHDLKEPINSVSGLLDIILKDSNKLSQSQLECVDHIQKTVKKSRVLLGRILNSKEIDHYSKKLKPEKVDICLVLENNIESFSKKAKEKAITIESHSREKEIFVVTDLMLVSQVFQNIISNSLKFSPKNSIVKISMEKMDKNLKIEFQDQGPGIAKEEVDQLFDKYTKLSNKPTNGESSSGLGLSLVKRYSDLLGANIWYESGTEKGANFIFLLPLNI